MQRYLSKTSNCSQKETTLPRKKKKKEKSGGMRSRSVAPSDINSALIWTSSHRLKRSRREIEIRFGAFGATVDNSHSDRSSSFIRDFDFFTAKRVVVWIGSPLSVIQGSRNGTNEVGILAGNTTRSQTGIIESTLSRIGSATIGATWGIAQSGSRSRRGG